MLQFVVSLYRSSASELLATAITPAAAHAKNQDYIPPNQIGDSITLKLPLFDANKQPLKSFKQTNNLNLDIQLRITENQLKLADLEISKLNSATKSTLKDFLSQFAQHLAVQYNSSNPTLSKLLFLSYMPTEIGAAQIISAAARKEVGEMKENNSENDYTEDFDEPSENANDSLELSDANESSENEGFNSKNQFEIAHSPLKSALKALHRHITQENPSTQSKLSVEQAVEQIFHSLQTVAQYFQLNYTQSAYNLHVLQQILHNYHPETQQNTAEISDFNSSDHIVDALNCNYAQISFSTGEEALRAIETHCSQLISWLPHHSERFSLLQSAILAAKAGQQLFPQPQTSDIPQDSADSGLLLSLESYAVELEELLAQNSALKQQNSTLSQQNSALEQQKTAWLAENHDNSADSLALEMTAVELRGFTAEMRELKADLEAISQQKISQESQFSTEKQLLLEENNGIRRDYEQLLAKIKQNRQNHTDLQRKLEDLQREHAELLQKHSDLERNLSQLHQNQAKFDQIKAENGEFQRNQRELDEKLKELRGLEGHHQELLQNREKLQQDYDNLQRNYDNLQRNHNELQQKARDWTRDKESLEQSSAALQETHEKLAENYKVVLEKLDSALNSTKMAEGRAKAYEQQLKSAENKHNSELQALEISKTMAIQQKCGEISAVQEKLGQLSAEIVNLASKNKENSNKNTEILADRAELQQKYFGLEAKLKELQREHLDLQETHEITAENNSKLKENIRTLNNSVDKLNETSRTERNNRENELAQQVSQLKAALQEEKQRTQAVLQQNAAENERKLEKIEKTHNSEVSELKTHNNSLQDEVQQLSSSARSHESAEVVRLSSLNQQYSIELDTILAKYKASELSNINLQGSYSELELKYNNSTKENRRMNEVIAQNKDVIEKIKSHAEEQKKISQESTAELNFKENKMVNELEKELQSVREQHRHIIQATMSKYTAELENINHKYENKKEELERLYDLFGLNDAGENIDVHAELYSRITSLFNDRKSSDMKSSQQLIQLQQTHLNELNAEYQQLLQHNELLRSNFINSNKEKLSQFQKIEKLVTANKSLQDKLNQLSS
jgi:hypothetical protein